MNSIRRNRNQSLATFLFSRFCRGIKERTPTCDTNTQYLLQRSGYEWVATTFGPLRGKRVLDAASGGGFGSELLWNQGARVCGIDIDEQVVARAARRYHAPFFCMDVSRMGFRDDLFDLIISEDTLEHVADDVSFIREAHRVLKPGGSFVVMTPHSPVHTLCPLNPYHLREYSPESLLSLLSQFFSDVRLFGRRPGAAMEKAEVEMNRVRRYDPWGIRRFLLPSSLRHRIGSWWLQQRGLRGLADLNAQDVQYFEGVEGSGTIIALCTKSCSRSSYRQAIP